MSPRSLFVIVFAATNEIFNSEFGMRNSELMVSHDGDG